MAIQFAYPWNTPGSALASPYLTYEQQHRRDRMFAALLHARKKLAHQPECVQFEVNRTARAEQNEAIKRITEEVHLTTGITISRGEALHLMAGGTSVIDGHWRRGTAKGELFSASPSYGVKAERILRRVDALTEKSRQK